MIYSAEFLAVLLPLTLTPGAALISLTGQGLIHGFYKSLPFYFGLLSAAFIMTLICSLGFSAFVLQNPYLYSFIKYAGIVYLVYLGIKLIKAKPMLNFEDESSYTFQNGFILSLFNPKLFVAIMSIFSQFVIVESDSTYVMSAFILMIAFSQAFWLGIGSFAKKLMSSHPPLNTITTGFGIILIGMSLYLTVKN